MTYIDMNLPDGLLALIDHHTRLDLEYVPAM
jgi:hypothetical protein